MWNYEKRLQHPVNITTPNAKLAQFIMSQYGGPDGEIGASMRYLSQRFTMPNRTSMAVLNDIGTEELAHKCYQQFMPLIRRKALTFLAGSCRIVRAFLFLFYQLLL